MPNVRDSQSIIEVMYLATATIRTSQSIVEVAWGLGVSCNSPANGQVGVLYSHTFTAGAGVPPYTFSVSAGSLPTGLSLSSGGVLSGVPTADGTFNFTIEVTDSIASTATVDCSITILPSGLKITLRGIKRVRKLAPDECVEAPLLDVPERVM